MENSPPEMWGSKSEKHYEGYVTDQISFSILCDQGHTSVVLLQVMRFELLFDQGISALRKGNYDSAVLRHSAAREKFFKFYCRVVWLQDHGDCSLFDEYWKHLRRSERQVGAFVATNLALRATSDFPKDLQKLKKGDTLRNAIAHSGKIPCLNEAKEYAERTYEFISKYCDQLKVHFPKGISKETLRVFKEQSANIHDQLGVSRNSISGTTVSVPTSIGLNHGLSAERKSFEEVLATDIGGKYMYPIKS
ncbi:hypothetical protein [uncultured Roseobacter sp.]|uniref:hypothetical protein n=1 Tax=uncultured Roseobacter sp. TaxID=114847 RepID=UPI0026271A16|nr:hypothetical protein [uncultured Roseobacter sp.]